MYTLIVRQGCHLCEQAEISLAQLESETGLAWQTVDIDSDPALAKYTNDLPVLLEGGKVKAILTSSKAALAKATRPTLLGRIKSSLHLN
ncbi:MAG: glutaredoxin family protein [Flaviflexus sp.]|uniref:glutaredoxin family protein n=1 Tax=Flaviflexus sp. TaxID=1969482 RepID=UPI00352D5201